MRIVIDEGDFCLNGTSARAVIGSMRKIIEDGRIEIVQIYGQHYLEPQQIYVVLALWPDQREIFHQSLHNEFLDPAEFGVVLAKGTGEIDKLTYESICSFVGYPPQIIKQAA
jgi:hypothetical protein